jgi:2-iminoacetate synthase
MEFSVPGFIKRFCSPNALLTLAEYLEDYAPQETKTKGYELINTKIRDLANHQDVGKLKEKIQLIKEGSRDLYF